MHGYIFEFVKFKAYKHILSICDFIYLISLVEKHWLKLICFITIWFSLLLLLLLLSLFSHVQLCATPWTAAYQAFLSMGFSRQEHWSGLPFPSPRWMYSYTISKDFWSFLCFLWLKSCPTCTKDLQMLLWPQDWSGGWLLSKLFL